MIDLSFNHFDIEPLMYIEKDVSGYTISGILSQLTLDNLSQWHLITFFSQKIIAAETWYKTYENELWLLLKYSKLKDTN